MAENMKMMQDLSDIFNAMKKLDPRSVVREGEMVDPNAQVVGINREFANMYNDLLKGKGLTDMQRDAVQKVLKTVVREGEMPMERTVVREAEVASKPMTDKMLNNMSTPMMLDFINDMPEDMKEAMMALISTGTDFATALDIVRGNDKFVTPSPEMRANEMGALGNLAGSAMGTMADPRSVVREGEQMVPKMMEPNPNMGRTLEDMLKRRQDREDMITPAMGKGLSI